MSVIIAIKDKERVIIGADSQVTYGGSRKTLSNPNNYKVWAVHGVDHCLMAGVGSLRDLNILRVATGLVDELTTLKKELNFEYVVRHVVQHIMDELNKSKRLSDSEGFPVMRSAFLLAYENQIYQIERDGAVIEIDDFVAIGSGAPEAIGSLISTEGMEAKERIVRAIKSSVTNDLYVNYPIVMIDTIDNHTIIIKDK
jgi:ATP-dependent protease HslVU (ClpYQ) peptidase subunit